MMRIMDPVLKLLLGSPLASRMGGMTDMLALLRFTGRTSGRQFTIPVGYHRFSGEPEHRVYLVTSAPWWRNLRKDAPVVLRLKGRDVPGRATAVTNRAAVERRYRELLTRHGVKNAYRLGLTLDASHEPTNDEFLRAIDGHVIIRVELSPAAG